MLVKRRITLLADVLHEPILRREQIADSLLASEILEQARAQAERLLPLQEAQAQAVQRQALADFWQQANTFLQAVQEQRQGLQQAMFEALETLLSQALAHLLDSTALAERVRALLRHLAQSQSPAAVATLRVHPDVFETVAQWLAASQVADYWQLKPDPALLPESLCLSHEHGQFEITWGDLRDGLLGSSAPAVLPAMG
jgi:type III secretion protein L